MSALSQRGPSCEHSGCRGCALRQNLPATVPQQRDHLVHMQIPGLHATPINGDSRASLGICISPSVPGTTEVFMTKSLRISILGMPFKINIQLIPFSELFTFDTRGE